jgi:outer membrane receptor protein involved in Fe transport
MVLRILRHILFTIFLCFIFETASAQNVGKIWGVVKDEKNRLEYVTVNLVTSSDTTKPIYFTTTDSLGTFTLDNIPQGNYQIKISMIGYGAVIKKLQITGTDYTVNFNTIILTHISTIQNTVTIVGQKKLIEKTPEGFIVNAAANITQLGGTATDVFKNIPTVTVDAEGGISLRGKTPLILINGRNSTIKSMDQIAASSIETIEIINNATAKYDANAETGIINIKLKKNTQKGTNGAIALSMGFGAKGRINSAAIINHKIKKWNLGLAYDNRFAGRNRKITGSRTNYNLQSTYLITQNRKDDRLEQLQNLKVNLDYAPNSNNNFSLEVIGNKEGQNNGEDLESAIWTQNNTFNNRNDRYSLEIERNKTTELALGYERKFKDTRKSLSANIASSFSKENQNTDITIQQLDEFKLNMGNPNFGKTHNYENASIITTTIDYSFPITKKSLITTGYKGNFRGISANYETGDYINGNYVTNTLASNIFIFKEQVNAMYIMYNSFIGNEDQAKWKFNLGLRGEQVNNNGKTQQLSSKFNNHYLKLFPTASAVYYKTQNEFWKVSYGKRINRPSLGQLNPFIDITDALNPHSGNPNLKPEIIDALELGYNKEWQMISLSTTIFYRYAIDNIRQINQLQNSGVNLLFPINIGSNTTYGFENIVSAKPNKNYNLNFSFSLYQINLNGSNNGIDLVQQAINYNIKLINSITPWQGGKIQLISNYISPVTTPQGKRITQYNIDLGIQQKLGKGSARLGLAITDFTNSLKSGYHNNTIDFSNERFSKADTRAFVLTYAYTFKSSFKEKLLENKFSAE